MNSSRLATLVALLLSKWLFANPDVLINAQVQGGALSHRGVCTTVLTGSNDTSTGLGLTSTFTSNTFQDNYEINAAVTATSYLPVLTPARRPVQGMIS